MSDAWPTPFEHASPAELAAMRRQLLDAQQLARTYGYNTADAEVGRMRSDLADEVERRAATR